MRFIDYIKKIFNWKSNPKINSAKEENSEKYERKIITQVCHGDGLGIKNKIIY